MEIPDELKKKIENTFFYDEELKKKLLSLDGDAIRFIGRMSQTGIKPERIVKKFESGDSRAIYEEAKIKLEAEKIYKELHLIYTETEIEGVRNNQLRTKGGQEK